MIPFEVKDCALLMRMSGLAPAMNLRELRDRIAVCGDGVLYHHFFETTLRPTFDDPDYRNDFAVWAKGFLGDLVLAEKLGIVDPYACETMDDLRSELLEIIDDRLGDLTVVPWARPGDEFFFKESTTVIFDTGERVQRPEDLGPTIRRMTNGSVYYHFLEALRRPPVGRDDFSAWLAEAGPEYSAWGEALAAIDAHFLGLAGLREELARALSPAGAAR